MHRSMRTVSKWKHALTRKKSSVSLPGDNNLECISCMEKFSRPTCIVAPCGHAYCRRCVDSLVETCLRDERLFPVKCCMEHIPTAQLTGFLSFNLRSRFTQKALEFSTSADWRVYCRNASCSAFIGSSCGETKNMRCSACGRSTCTGCKQRPHPAADCRGSAETLKFRRLIQKERWQTCPGCSAVVEQKAGCNHITCRCRSEFCYLCGVKWKTCDCPQFGDPRPSEEPQLEVTGNELDEDVRGEEGFLEPEQELAREPPSDDHEGTYTNPHDVPLNESPPPYSEIDEWDGNVPDFESSQSNNVPQPPVHDSSDEWDGNVPDSNFLGESSQSNNVPQPPIHDSSDDEGLYINPYLSGLGPGSSGGDLHPTLSHSSHEGFTTNPYDPEQGFENLFLPDREVPDPSDNEGQYINPFDLGPDFSTSFADLQIHDTSSDGDEGTFSDWHNPEPRPAFSHIITQYYDLPDDDDGPYINPYD